MTVRGPAKRKGDRVSSPSLAQQAYLFEQDKLGKGWLGDDAKKDYGFHVLRLATLAMPPDAVVIVTPTNALKPTAKFKFRGETAKRATDTPEKRRQLVAEDRMELVDSVTAVAQTPQRVCSCVQRVERGVYVGGPTAIGSAAFTT